MQPQQIFPSVIPILTPRSEHFVFAVWGSWPFLELRLRSWLQRGVRRHVIFFLWTVNNPFSTFQFCHRPGLHRLQEMDLPYANGISFIMMVPNEGRPLSWAWCFISVFFWGLWLQNTMNKNDLNFASWDESGHTCSVAQAWCCLW